jgi:hypothetical protein
MADSKTTAGKQAIFPTTSRNVEPSTRKALGKWGEEGLSFQNTTLRLQRRTKRESERI